MIIDELTEKKKKAILKECRASHYCDDYSKPFAQTHAASYESGVQDGIKLATTRLVDLARQYS